MKIVCEWILPPSYQLIFRTETMLTMKKLFKAKWAAGSESNRVFNMPESQESLALYISLGFLNCLFPLKRFFFPSFFIRFYPLRASAAFICVCALREISTESAWLFSFNCFYIAFITFTQFNIYNSHSHLCISRLVLSALCCQRFDVYIPICVRVYVYLSKMMCPPIIIIVVWR